MKEYKILLLIRRVREQYSKCELHGPHQDALVEKMRKEGRGPFFSEHNNAQKRQCNFSKPLETRRSFLR